MQNENRTVKTCCKTCGWPYCDFKRMIETVEKAKLKVYGECASWRSVEDAREQFGEQIIPPEPVSPQKDIFAFEGGEENE